MRRSRNNNNNNSNSNSNSNNNEKLNKGYLEVLVVLFKNKAGDVYGTKNKNKREENKIITVDEFKSVLRDDNQINLYGIHI